MRRPRLEGYGRAIPRLWVVVTAMLIITACAGRMRPASVPQSPQAATSRRMTFIATAYCRGTTTAAGTPVSNGVAAADPAVLPLGTVIQITGVPAPYDRLYRVLDTGPKIQGQHVDLYMVNCSEARRFGRRTVSVMIVR